MKLHWSSRSPFVRKVMIVAHETGLADHIACVRTVVAPTKPNPDVMALNPLNKLPTLVLNAQNDPFLPARFLPTPHEMSTNVLLETPHTGGHVGFVGGRFPGNISWLTQRLLHFFAAE